MTQSTSEPMINIQGLTKKYGSFVAVDNLTMQVPRGAILGFIGPNGAGKTTTIQTLVGLLKPTSGTATVAGLNCLTDSRRVRSKVGFMPDTFAGYDNMRVREYLDFFGAAFGIPRAQRASRIDDALELAGAPTFKDLYTNALSHGMKQRVSLARAVLHNPDVLILDEPTNGLDPLARVEMRESIVQLAQRGKTVLVTSHILPELSRICTTVAIITRGKLRAFGTMEEIVRRVRQVRVMEVILLQENDLPRAQVIARTSLDPTARITVQPAEAMLRIETTADDSSLANLLKQLIHANVAVAQYREVVQGLEDALLTMLADQSDTAHTSPPVEARR